MSDRDASKNRDKTGHQRAKAIAANFAKAFLTVGCVAFFLSCWRGGGQQLLPPRSSSREFKKTQAPHPKIPNIPAIELERSEQFEKAVALKSEKIVYCPIEKVACTEWLKVFRWIDGQEEWQQPRHMKHGLDKLSHMKLKRANNILNSPEWLKLVVVREPTERLLSCFLQKCKTWNFKKEYSNCPYLELWPDLFPNTYGTEAERRRPSDDTHDIIINAFKERGWQNMFTDYVESIARKVKANPCHENPHWAPQYCHCSLDRTFSAYHIVGWANMTEAVVSAIVPGASTPERGREVAEFLRGRMESNHEKHGKKTEAALHVQEVYSEDMLGAVREAYAKDYILFSQYWQ